MSNVTMFAPAGSGGSVQTDNSGTVFVASNGTVSISPLDVPTFQKLGFKIATTRHAVYTTPAIPGVALATETVTSVSLANGTLTIAAQPVVPRPLQAVIDPGAAAITAGVLTLTYTGNDGQTHVDALSVVVALASVLTIQTSYGVEHLTSAIVTGLVGGSSPKVRGVGTNPTLALPVDGQFASLTVTKETIISTTITTGITTGVDETVGSVLPSMGCIIPTTAPNASQLLSFGYNYLAP